MSSNKTNTSVDDVKSWWDDKKEARVASWWDDKKNARVASWWDDKKNARVASWWDDKKNARVASWWDTKKAHKKTRVASPWWDTKKASKKARVASWWDTKNVKDWDWDTKKNVKDWDWDTKKAVKTPKVKTATCGSDDFFGWDGSHCFDRQAGYVVPCGHLSANHYHCCMTVTLPCQGAHKTWYKNHGEDDD